MIWVMSERRVLKKLNKMTRFVPKRKEEKGVYKSSNYSDYIRWNKGIEEVEFMGTLFNEEFGHKGFLSRWFKSLYVRFRPSYLQLFHADLKRIIGNSLFINRNKDQSGFYLTVNSGGKKLISWTHYPKLFLNNVYVKAIIIAAVSLITTYFISKMLGISPKFN